MHTRAIYTQWPLFFMTLTYAACKFGTGLEMLSKEHTQNFNFVCAPYVYRDFCGNLCSTTMIHFISSVGHWFENCAKIRYCHVIFDLHGLKTKLEKKNRIRILPYKSINRLNDKEIIFIRLWLCEMASDIKFWDSCLASWLMESIKISQKFSVTHLT